MVWSNNRIIKLGIKHLLFLKNKNYSYLLYKNNNVILR